MKILHICSYYVGSLVYKKLFESLDSEERVSKQYVWVPVRKHHHEGKNLSSKKKIKIIYVKSLDRFTRLSFLYKLLRLVLSFHRDQKRADILQGCNVIHAHTLYSDGYLAYWLSRKYQIPYVLSIRTTDVSVFERFLPHWRWMTRRVIANAQCLIFISPAHKITIEAKYANDLPKTLLVTNGLDEYWISNAICSSAPERSKARSGIYIGEINANKNIKRAILAFFKIADDNDATFTVLGGEYSTFSAIYGEIPEVLRSRVDFISRTEDKQCIKELLRQHQVLIMPSFMETFGLTYLEAISQCVPVVFSHGQGIDGLYPEGMVGFSCDPSREESIADAILNVFKHFPEGLIFEGNNPVEDYSWQSRAQILMKNAY
ncbi:glycosyltransferase family 4 protein [Halomonas alkaliantarctica]|uniref:Glycosyltransferase family 4 protein n=1 Tax=Halomonas alkaliantarctica TaxID=232346 RepID=A0ABY8LQC1_9GAMM|nr:glycosyltransferase family 4 protein [Halomonas alkaliantarctica]WGI26622.1 glycosyltransferase family 4 protein [Halomonas alkaliantarctica]